MLLPPFRTIRARSVSSLTTIPVGSNLTQGEPTFASTLYQNATFSYLTVGSKSISYDIIALVRGLCVSITSSRSPNYLSTDGAITCLIRSFKCHRYVLVVNENLGNYKLPSINLNRSTFALHLTD